MEQLFFNSAHFNKFPIISNVLKYLIDESVDECGILNTIKIILHWRNCRGGNGNINDSLCAFLYIEKNWLNDFIDTFKLIPEYGSWLDLIKLWHYVSMYSKRIIMQYIVENLHRDFYNNNKKSLLSKWFPSENSKWDRMTHTRFNIEACHIFFGVDVVQNKHLATLRKIISILRKDVIESKISNRLEINYNDVPVLALNKFKRYFFLNDYSNFDNYIFNKKCNTIINNDLYIDSIRDYVCKHKHINTTLNTVCVCDTSESMLGIPMAISIIIGILFSYKNNGNYNISFNENPILYRLPDDYVTEQINYVKSLESSDRIRLSKVLNIVYDLKNIDRIYIFSDKPYKYAIFDESIYSIKCKFLNSHVPFPQIIYWNIRDKTFNYSDNNSIKILSGINMLNNVLDNKLDKKDIIDYTLNNYVVMNIISLP